MRLLAAAFAALTSAPILFASPVSAECAGRNLMAELDTAQRDRIDRAVDAVPYHSGLFWEARKDGLRMVLIGTYHFADPRHDLTVQAFGGDIASADKLLVEAGPQETDRLQQAMADDPSLMMVIDGPTLPERLDDDAWADVSQAMSERGFPAIIASKMQPWYVAMMMGMSPCMIRQTAEAGSAGGLDQLLMESAHASGTPIAALEPWNTLFSLFADMTPDEEIEMILAALPAAAHADDYGTTLIDAYFDQDVWRIWEFGRIDAYANSGLPAEAVDKQMRFVQEKLMEERNQAWIAPLTEAAVRAGPGGHVVAGFGALHLPGEKGVLNLLEQDGWTLTRQEVDLTRPAVE